MIDETCCLQKFLILHTDSENFSARHVNSTIFNYLCPVLGHVPFHVVTADTTISYQEIWSCAKLLREYTNQTTLLHSQDHCLYTPETTGFSLEYKNQKAKIDFLYQITSLPELTKYISDTLRQYDKNRTPQHYAEYFIYQCYRVLPLLFSIEEKSCRQSVNHILSSLHESTDTDQLCEKITASLSELFFNHSSETNTDSLPQKIRQYIDAHYHQEITAETLSRRYGYTPSYINRIFKRDSGTTPLQYVTALRMERAKELLLQDIDIKKIAAATGYEDARYFSRVFKNETGLTPSAWAHQAKREPL